MLFVGWYQQTSRVKSDKEDKEFMTSRSSDPNLYIQIFSHQNYANGVQFRHSKNEL